MVDAPGGQCGSVISPYTPAPGITGLITRYLANAMMAINGKQEKTVFHLSGGFNLYPSMSDFLGELEGDHRSGLTIPPRATK